MKINFAPLMKNESSSVRVAPMRFTTRSAANIAGTSTTAPNMLAKPITAVLAPNCSK